MLNYSNLSESTNLLQTLFVVTIVPIAIQYGNSFLAFLSEIIKNWVDDFFTKRFKRKVKIVVQSENQDGNGRSNELFLAINSFLNDIIRRPEINSKTDNIIPLVEFKSNKNEMMYFPKPQTVFRFFVDQSKKFQLIQTPLLQNKDQKWQNKDILDISITFVSPEKEKDRFRHDKSFEIEMHNSHETKDLDSFVRHISDLYLEKHHNQCRLVSISDNNVSDTTMSRTVTFDGLLMNETLRNEIRFDLQQFWNDEAHYAKISQPHRCGFFLIGKPGTGKTSFVRCLVAESLPHIVEVMCLKFPARSKYSKNEIKYILDRAKYNTTANTKTIWIIEDIDCIANFLNKRSTSDSDDDEDDESDGDDNNNLNGFSIDSDQDTESESKKSNSKKSSKSNKKQIQTVENDSSGLSMFLNHFDGIDTPEHLLIVFTSNHPEKLDPALVRPGRMDKIYNFDNIIDLETLVNFGKRFFSDVGSHFWPDVSFYETLLQKNLTNASIVQIMKRYRLRVLKKNEIITILESKKIIEDFINERQTNGLDDSIFV